MLKNFLTIGSLTEDIVFFTPDGLLLDNKKDLLRQKLLAFEYGAKVNIKNYGHYFGGGASNTAVNLVKAGFRVSCLAQAGSDERGSRIIKNLKSFKVNTNNIIVDEKNDSGFSFILSNNQDRIIFVYRGSNDFLKIEKKHGELIKNHKWVYLTSLPDNYLSSLKNIFAFKNKIAWNPGLNQLSGGVKKIGQFLKKTDIFMVNKDEALELVKNSSDYSSKSNSFLNNIFNLIKILKNFGPEKIILTDGVRGAYFYDGKYFYHQAIIKGQKMVDTTGVGDAFNSTVVGALEKFSGDYKRAMLLGVKNTASVVSKSGAQNGLLDFTKI